MSKESAQGIIESLRLLLTHENGDFGEVSVKERSLDCKTVGIFAYSSTREQSNKRSGTKLKTESETGERR